MALTVGELQVILEARTSEFRSAIRNAEGRLSTFEQRSNRRIDRVRGSFNTLGNVVLGVGAALATIGLVRGFTRLVAESIRTAASFEQLEVRLRSFLGSQEEASQALRDFIELSASTPFAVEQVAQAGANLGSVALANRERLLQLTQTAANLAAVTGLSLQEASSNLQRTLTAGIAAADLFRERGVRALVEAVQGIPDLTALPLAQAGAAVEATFGPNGVFATAAEDLQFTLGGALSNVGDAVQRFQAALGEAISPAVGAGLREFLIPLFDTLRELVDENSSQIRDFAFNTIRATVRFVSLLARAFSTAAGALAQLDRFVKSARLGFNELLLVFFRLVRAFDGLPASARTAIQAVSPALGALVNVASGVSDNVDETIAALETLNARFRGELEGPTLLEDFAEGANVLSAEVENLANSFNQIDFSDLTAQSETAAQRLERVRQALEDARARTEGGALDPTALRAQETQLKAIERRILVITTANQRSVEPLQAQIGTLNRQLARLTLIQRTKENTARIDAAQNTLLEERVRVQNLLVEATTKQAEEQARVSRLLGRLQILDPEAADDLAQDFADAFSSARGAEARAEVAEDFARKIQEEIDEVRPPRFDESLAAGTTDAIRSALDVAFGEESFTEAFGRRLEDRSREGLEKAFDGTLKSLESSLEGIFADVPILGQGGILSNIAGPIGSLLTGAIGSALRGGQVTTAAENITSAITSAQRVRGIVAGPQQIGVAQVSRGIQEAFQETNAILRGPVVGQLDAIRRNTAGGGQTGATPLEVDEAEFLLAGESPSLV